MLMLCYGKNACVLCGSGICLLLSLQNSQFQEWTCTQKTCMRGWGKNISFLLLVMGCGYMVWIFFSVVHNWMHMLLSDSLTEYVCVTRVTMTVAVKENWIEHKTEFFGWCNNRIKIYTQFSPQFSQIQKDL